MDLKDRIQKVIDQRRATLLKERDKYEEKMRDTMSFYGVGGAYRRQEAARDKREEQLNELADFEKQLSVIRQIKRCRFHQIKTGLSEHLTMG